MWINIPIAMYDYRMTYTAAIISREGIACISDSRSFEANTGIEHDDEKKIFEFSPTCAVMIAGGMIEGMKIIVESLVMAANAYCMVAADDVADFLTRSFNYKTPDWLKNNGITFIVAGYTINQQPFVTKIMEFRDEWVSIPNSAEQSFCTAGDVTDQVHNSLNAFTANMALERANRMALQTFHEACQTKISYKGKTIYPVGGNPQLYNIYPDKLIKMFSQEEIAELCE